MFFSLTSFMTAFVGGCIMIILLMLYSNNIGRVYAINYRLLFLIVAWILLRLLLPFETAYTITIPIKSILPSITEFFRQDIYIADRIHMYVYQPIVGIWIVGGSLRLIRGIYEYSKIAKLVHSLPRDEDHSSSEHVLIDEGVEVIRTCHVKSPVVFGIRKAKILLPDLEFGEEEKEFILIHELQHLKNQDLLFKLLLEVLTVIYWWNPFMVILKKQIWDLLEMRVDSEISLNWSREKCIRYLELLLRLGRHQYRSETRLRRVSMSFSENSSSVLKRSRIIMNYGRKEPISFVVICSLIVVTFSCFIFEPYNIKAVHKEGAFGEESFKAEGYILKRDTEYLVYIEGELVGSIENPDSKEFSNFPIYNNIKEAETNEKD